VLFLSTRRPPLLATLGLIASALLAVTVAPAAARSHIASTSAGRAPLARTADYAQQCPEPYSGQRDPANPLALPVPPGPNPLNGANFFVDGPAHGSAASAIAQLLGLNPKAMPNSESWAQFAQQLRSGPFAARLAADPGLASQVAALSKIAAQPEAQRFSNYSMGGGPGALFKQAEKIFCSNMTADPGSIPIINTYFLHAGLGGCPTTGQIQGYGPTFRRRVDEVAAATDRRPAVYLVEIDGLGSTGCISRHGSLPAWEAALRYEVNKLQALPHTVVYVEGGYSDANSVKYTAKALNAIGVRNIRGFFTNDTHENWTMREVRWATKIAKLTHGAHFIVNTAQNGRGPLLNPHPTTQGIENLCNPPQRGLGIPDTTNTGFAYADAFMWTHPPGNSSGCGGGPPGGVFWPARAIQLAQNANLQLGPGLASHPY
jgi:endoglucanase